MSTDGRTNVGGLSLGGRGGRGREPQEIANEMHAARDDFRTLLDGASSAELRAATNGTRWTNEQLLFHMLFGYLLVRNLRPLVMAFGLLPDTCSRAFAAVLNAGTRPFHVVNYVGSLGGARVLGHARMERLMDRVIASIMRSLMQTDSARLERGNALPGRLGSLLP